MAEMTKETMLQIVNDNIERIENKDFNVYFFVLDTAGNASSALEYIYQTALVLKNKGYNVTMLHQEKNFVGVGDWLGEEYANLPHRNIDTDNVEIKPSDFLFIPEIFANVIQQTAKLPCKRVMLVQNYNHVTEFMPVTVNMSNFNITDAVVTTQTQATKIRRYFPMMRTHVVSPSIKKVFRAHHPMQKLIVNVICKEQTTINQIIKPFYWENPIYNWITFRDLRNLSQAAFADALSEGAITIWVDDNTNFGYTLLEALRSGTLVLAKIPDHLSDWMIEKDGDSEKLTDKVLWFDDIDRVGDMLSRVVRSWTLDQISKDIYTAQESFNDMYSEETQEKEIESVYINGLFERRLNDFKETKADIESGVLKPKTKEE